MPPSANIEAQYQEAIAALSPAERVARSAALFAWTRDQLARQIVAEQGAMDSEQLKWEVAMRLYGNEPTVRRLIQRKLDEICERSIAVPASCNKRKS